MDSTRELAIYVVYSRGEDTMRTVNIYGAGLIGRIDVRYVPATYIDPETNEPVQTTVRRDERFYYINDHLGSVRAIVDSSGTTVFAQDTYPYGDVYRNYSLGGYSDQKYDFTGKERDVETGLHYYGARYYDSDLGVWLQVDPLADRRQGITPYNYCQNNPIIRIDPYGRLDEGLEFDEDGNYTGKHWDDGKKEYTGHVKDTDGKELLTFEFLDPSDALSIISTKDESGNATAYSSQKKNSDGTVITGIDLTFGSKVDKIVSQGLTGINNSPNKVSFVVKESQPEGSMDYLSSGIKNSLAYNKLAVINNIAYNQPDAGNYCWGAAMGKLGFSSFIAQLGAQIYEIGWNKRLDQPTDQSAIKNGVLRK